MSKYNFKTNSVYCGNNLDIISDFPNECVDLIYIDPPFNSGKQWELLWKDDKETREFKDRWGSVEHYTEYMEPRIIELYRILKSTGSFYLHCDSHASGYLRVLCDNIFGYNHFQNEIIWHYTGGLNCKNSYPSKHDNILYYTKGEDWIFNIIRVPYGENSGYAKGGIVSKTGKKYNPNPLGKPIDDVWDIPIINPMAKERLGYPTQKPEALLERIIKASSNEGDIILDAFCGCGTTLAVAKRLNRNYIGIDVARKACEVISERIGYNKNDIIRLDYTLEEVMIFLPSKFQNWACEKIGGVSNSKKSGDGGVDGWKYKKGERYPIQVKQSSIGRPVIQQFEAVILQYKSKKGFIIGHKFAKPAIEEIERFNREHKEECSIINLTTGFVFGYKEENGNGKNKNIANNNGVFYRGF